MLNTRQKIIVARALSLTIVTVRRLFGRTNNVRVRRNQINWSLDLNEGIDLSIYLLGGFEVRTTNNYPKLVNEGDIVLDIGANVGSHTLPLARLVGPLGRVISFEPTKYAFEKQRDNICLNPQLAPRITAHQAMLTHSETASIPEAIYSSWPLETTTNLHNEHRGRLMATDGAKAFTLDEFVQSEGFTKVDFIKIDVDGNEVDVLAGAKFVLATFKPKLIIELAPHLYSKRTRQFDEMLEFLWHCTYTLYDSASNKPLPQSAEQIRALIPNGGGINVIAISAAHIS